MEQPPSERIIPELKELMAVLYGSLRLLGAKEYSCGLWTGAMIAWVCVAAGRLFDKPVFAILYAGFAVFAFVLRNRRQKEIDAGLRALDEVMQKW